MKIRNDQVEQMSQARRKESFRRLLAELRQSAPLATSHLDDANLLAIIEQATEKARKYGVKSSKATTAFVKIAVFAGISFDEEATTRQYLLAPELDPDFKVILLADLVSMKVKEST